MPSILDDRKKDGIAQINIKKIKPNRYQPRKGFDDSKIDELVTSIKEQGVIQPVIVRVAGDGYELIVGERRLRAVAKAGLEVIPAIVRDVSNAEMLEMALVENLQRESLNPLEEAEAYQQLMVEFNFTQEEVAQKVGKERSTISNMLRLLKLPDQIKESFVRGTLSVGHAKAILSLDDEANQILLCNKIIKDSLPVRRAEMLARSLRSAAGKKTLRIEKDSYILSLEEELRQLFGTKVNIKYQGKNRGKLEIEFYSDEDLSRIIEKVGK
jgi:ParB family chromosome partitioning protein